MRKALAGTAVATAAFVVLCLIAAAWLPRLLRTGTATPKITWIGLRPVGEWFRPEVTGLRLSPAATTVERHVFVFRIDRVLSRGEILRLPSKNGLVRTVTVYGR